MILSTQEISKKLMMAYGKKVSPKSIHVFADKLGYHLKRVGGKKGYHQSLYTDLARHLKELFDYDDEQKGKVNKKPATKVKPQGKDGFGNYYAYNGEPDRVDYEWEKNEGIIKRSIIESINEILGVNIL